MHTINETKTYM